MMKKLLYILPLLLASCSASKYTIKVAAGTDASEPDKGNFIKMKSGREVKLSDNVEILSGMPEVDRTRMIKIGDKKYKGKDIGSFQLNGDYYSNTAKNTFARRIYRGPVNVFQNTITTTTSSYSHGSTGGSWSSSTSQHTNFYVQSPKIDKGELTQIYFTGSNKALEPYLKDYKPAYDILKKYQQQRKVSRIVKFSTVGFWLASIPAVLLAPEGSVMQNVAAANFALGLFYVPPITIGFKYRNHARPREAVQKYIDNVIPADIPVAQKATAVKDTAAQPVATTASPNPNTQMTGDFIELNNKELIAAEPGTKLKSANNKIFTINGQKYTSGITAFQINKKFYKHFSDMKEPSDFAQRSINGKISVYNVVHGSQNTSSALSPNFSARSSKWEYFQKQNEERFIKGRTKLAPMFEDDPVALGMYRKCMSHLRTTRMVSYSLSLVTLGGVAGVFAFKSSTAKYIATGASLGAALVNFRYVVSQNRKLNKEFIDVLNTYNGSKKGKKAIARKGKE